MGLTKDDHIRLSRQCELILEMLRQGPRTNVELSSVALKYTSRLSDIRKAGFDVRCERMHGGLTKYTLIGRVPDEGEQLELAV